METSGQLAFYISDPQTILSFEILFHGKMLSYSPIKTIFVLCIVIKAFGVTYI